MPFAQEVAEGYRASRRRHPRSQPTDHKAQVDSAKAGRTAGPLLPRRRVHWLPASPRPVPTRVARCLAVPAPRHLAACANRTPAGLRIVAPDRRIALLRPLVLAARLP